MADTSSMQDELRNLPTSSSSEFVAQDASTPSTSGPDTSTPSSLDSVTMAGFIPSPSETETDNSSDNYAEVSEETSQVRFGWQNMLESVVQGDIFKGEKLRISEAITGEADWELLHDQIWLELRAKLHGRTVDGERTHIAHRRLDTHDAAIQSIIDFQAEDNQTSVPSQVEQVLTALARAKSYYPSIEAFWRDKPSGLDSTMRERQDALCAWSNATLLIRNIQPRIYFWSEDDLHEDMPMAATWTESPRNEERTPEELRAHLVLKRHSIRILQNASLLQHFEQTFMSIIPRIITKARNDQLDYGHLLNEMHLPRLEETIIPLVRFPFDFITMLLRMQSRHVRSFRTPNAIMIDELAEQLREKIGLACALVPIYEPLVQSSLGGFWTMPQKADSSYDHAVLEAVQCLFNLMETKLKLMAPDRFFHEADLLVSQQTVLADVGGRIEHGFMFVSEQLCLLTEGALIHASEYLHRSARTPSSESSDERLGPWLPTAEETAQDLLSRYQRVMAGGHIRYRKLMRFVTQLSSTYSNAAEYEMRDHGLPPFVNSLADLGFVLVRTRGSSSVYAFASTLVDDRRDAILRILTSDFTGFNDLAHGGYEGDDVPPYLLIVGSGTEFSWKGSVIEEDLEVPFTVKNDRIRLIADGTERTLRFAKRHFLNEVIGSHKVTCIKEAMSGIKSVQRALRRVFAARVTLADAFIQSTNRAWMQFRATFTSHVFLQEILSEAAEYALTTTRKSTREGVLITQSLLADATLSWLTFISEDCDSDDRHTFAWAVKALEFVKEHVIASPLIPTQFEDLRRAVGGCMSLLIGHYNVPMLRSEEQERQDAALLDATDSSTRGRRRRKPDKAAGRNESQTITAREQAVLQAIQEIETSREERLRKMRLAGVVLEDQSRETAMLAAASSNLTIRWKRGRFIGSGASGSIHLAVDLDSGAVMAVKEIDFHRASAQAIKDVQLLFKQELDVMEMLQHSNIVTYHGIEVHREKVYIFQEYCSGGSLEEVLEMGRIEDDIIVQIYTLQMFEALAYLHLNGITHGDVKPANILLASNGTLKLADFGTATAVLGEDEKTITSASIASRSIKDQLPRLAGTPMYMAPEIIKGGIEARFGAGDVWSAGCVTLRMCTGRQPWDYDFQDEWATMFHIATSEHPPLLPKASECSTSGIAFLVSCLQMRAAIRPTCDALLQHEWMRDCRQALQLESSP